ncbi:MAG: hypothetical protein ACRDLF_06930 [Solirubrobacteraceae bacterium]
MSATRTTHRASRGRLSGRGRLAVAAGVLAVSFLAGVSAAVAAGAPTLGVPLAAASITRTSATLLGGVDPQESATSYQFEYGTSTGYGQLTSPAGIGEGDTEVPVEQGLEGLVPGATYHYALIASNQNGTIAGPDQTLTTSPPTPPVVLNGGQASSVTINDATLSATIDPEGLETSYVLELGSDTGYGTSIAGEVGAGAQPVSVEVPIIDLEPATTYHYRFVAVSGDGRTPGPDETFTTPAYAHPIMLPVVEPLLATPAVVFPTEEGRQVVRPAKHKAKKRKPKKKKKPRSRRGARR